MTSTTLWFSQENPLEYGRRRGNKGKVGIGDKESEQLLVAMDTSQ